MNIHTRVSDRLEFKNVYPSRKIQKYKCYCRGSILTFLILQERGVCQADQRTGHAGQTAHTVLVHQQARHRPGHGQDWTPTDLDRGQLVI